MVVFVYIVLCLIWGSTWMAIKFGLADAPPLMLLASRFIVATLLILVVLRIRGESLPRDPKRLLWLAYPGLFMFGMSYAFVYIAEMVISSALASVLFASYPFFVAIFTRLFLPEERLSMIGWVGLAVGFVGVLTISYDSLNLSGEVFLGTVLAVAAPLVSAYGITYHKVHFGREQVFPTLAIQLAAGGIPLTVLALLVENPSEFHLTAKSIGSVLFLGIFGTVVTFGGYYWLIKRIKMTHASLVAFLTPIVAILIGVVIYGESFRAASVVGTILVLSGVLLVILRQGRPGLPRT